VVRNAAPFREAIELEFIRPWSFGCYSSVHSFVVMLGQSELLPKRATLLRVEAHPTTILLVKYYQCSATSK
jgi:hypothetical protein